MKGLYGFRTADHLPHGFFQLGLGGISIAGQNLLGFSDGYFLDGGTYLFGRQQDDTTNLAEGNTGLRVFFKGKNIFDNEQIGLFSRKQLEKAGMDMLQPIGQMLSLAGPDGAEGVAGNFATIPGHKPYSGSSQPGIYSHNFDAHQLWTCCHGQSHVRPSVRKTLGHATVIVKTL